MMSPIRHETCRGAREFVTRNGVIKCSITLPLASRTESL
jgi:hypothetical protein